MSMRSILDHIFGRTFVRFSFYGWLAAATVFLCACVTPTSEQGEAVKKIQLDYNTAVDPTMQADLEAIDSKVRADFGMSTNHTAVGLLDLKTGRVAMMHPDRGEYAASVPKIGILLAYFQLRPQAVTNLDSQTRHELGLMAKASDNEMAAKFSRELGLKEIQKVINSYGFYDQTRGGGLWVGKHYGRGDERYGDPIGDNSHAATVRQLLSYFLMLEQGRLVSPEASKLMRDIFASPDIPHDDIKFVKALKDRNVQIIGSGVHGKIGCTTLQL